ncbi:hypothetical protein [Salinactinospora qingdaonensis]|uniref:Uncharacterized protein n=1 Tax=Salinactinospora qingdaonensis TaxID=702744 RepID=A0ABP7FPA6_9ACTN
MSSLESSASGSAGKRRRSPEGDDIEGLVAPPPRRRGGSRRRRRAKPKSGNKTLAILLGALGVAVIALVVVVLLRFVFGPSAAGGDAMPTAYAVYDSGEATEVLGERASDERLLSKTEVFDRGGEEIESQGITFTLAASDLTEDCSTAVWGEAVLTALGEADCTQAVRGGYTSDDYIGVTALFKLRDTEAAKAVASALQPPEESGSGEGGFIVPPTEDAPFDRIGVGFSRAEATTYGHYLLVVWTQSTDSQSPEERENLTSPLIALTNFDFPVYRRVLEQERITGGDTAGEGTSTAPAA